MMVTFIVRQVALTGQLKDGVEFIERRGPRILLWVVLSQTLFYRP